jgi:hypothetical protein
MSGTFAERERLIHAPAKTGAYPLPRSASDLLPEEIDPSAAQRMLVRETAARPHLSYSAHPLALVGKAEAVLTFVQIGLIQRLARTV